VWPWKNISFFFQQKENVFACLALSPAWLGENTSLLLYASFKDHIRGYKLTNLVSPLGLFSWKPL
jgi:hypothetical protein